MNNEKTVLPYEYEVCLVKCKNELFDQYGLTEKYPDILIRDKMLELLDEFCTVIYYPLKNEHNNGFHINDVPFYNGATGNFVFINTAQTIEKQVFTAAHELGHIWKVDDYVCDKLGLVSVDEDLREYIISRFAAIILMPEDEFVLSIGNILDKMNADNYSLDFMGVLKLIVMIMKEFFAPKKAVIWRMVEVGVLEKENAKILLGKGQKEEELVDVIIKQIISDLGYVEFQKPTEKKWIEGLSKTLDLAEKSGNVSQTKIDNIRKKFDLDKPISIDGEEVFTLNTQKGKSNNAT